MRGGFRNPLTTGATLADGSVSSSKIATNLQSDNYDGGVIAVNSGTVGWRIERNTGSSVFSNVMARGRIEAGSLPVIIGSNVGVAFGGTDPHHGIKFGTVDYSNAWVWRNLAHPTLPNTYYFRAGSATSYLLVDTALTPAVEMSGVNVAGNVTLITGGKFRTATSGRRIELDVSVIDAVRLFSGHASETTPGSLGVSADGTVRLLASNLGSGAVEFAIYSTIAAGGGSRFEWVDENGVTLRWNGGQLLGSGGTATAPAWSFLSDPNTGIFNPAADAIGFSTGATERGRFVAAPGGATSLQIETSGAGLRQVSFGAVDSGGAGFRLLRVPN